MSTPGTAVPKDALLSEIWRISTTLTEEAMAAALKECRETGFDPDRGIVPLQESFINLSSARNVLEDAIEKQKLIQLPLTVQKELLSSLQEISRALQSLMEGVDEVVNLTNAIELLNTAIWKYGLHNLSDQVLGYQRKLNQIKNQEVQLAKATVELKAAQEAAWKADSAASEIDQKRTEVLATVQKVKETCETALELLEQIQTADAKTSALFSTIEQHEKQSGELTANIKTTNHELSSLDGSIRKFYVEIDEYRRKINQTTEDATGLITNSEATVSRLVEDVTSRMDGLIEQAEEKSAAITGELSTKIEEHITAAKEAVEKLSTDSQTSLTELQTNTEEKLSAGLKKLMTASAELVTETQDKVEELEKRFEVRSVETIEANQKKTDNLIAELATLKEQIREQIQQATGFTLFGAFQSRQNEIEGAKSFWKWAIALLAVISAGVTVWIGWEAQYYSAHSFAFYVKLSLTIPLAFLITFCTVQYSRERRLEEEYAFKSSISVSLNPYRDLIQTMLDKEDKTEMSKYTEFVIESVRNVFTPPTDKVFESEKKNSITEKTFKHTAEVLGSFVKATKS